MDNNSNNNDTFTPQRRIFQQDITPGAVKPRHLVVSPLGNGDLYYSNGTNFENLPVGSAGQVLTVVNGVPVWQTPAAGSGNVSLLFAQTADVSVANTVVETTLIGAGTGSLTLPANYLTVGKTLRLTMLGTLQGEATNMSNLDIEIKLGGTPVAFTGLQNIIDANGGTWGLNVLLTCRAIGATGSVVGSGSSLYQASEALTDLIVEAVVFGVEEGAVAIDTTGTLAVNVTATWDTADANNNVTAITFTLEALG